MPTPETLERFIACVEQNAHAGPGSGRTAQIGALALKGNSEICRPVAAVDCGLNGNQRPRADVALGTGDHVAPKNSIHFLQVLARQLRIVLAGDPVTQAKKTVQIFHRSFALPTSAPGVDGRHARAEHTQQGCGDEYLVGIAVHKILVNAIQQLHSSGMDGQGRHVA